MRLTVLMIMLAVAVFAYQVLHGAGLAGEYGFSGENFLQRPYVAVTSIFLHGSIVHLLSNVFVWFFFGIAVESELGRARMLAIFFLGAFAGDIASLLAYGFGAVAIGASAGIFALVGAGMLVRPLDMSFYPLVIPIPLALLGMFYAVYNAYEFVFSPSASISYAGHFGGLAVGLLFGFKRKGFKGSLKIIIATLAAMIILPLVLLLMLGRI